MFGSTKLSTTAITVPTTIPSAARIRTDGASASNKAGGAKSTAIARPRLAASRQVALAPHAVGEEADPDRRDHGEHENERPAEDEWRHDGNKRPDLGHQRHEDENFPGGRDDEAAPYPGERDRPDILIVGDERPAAEQGGDGGARPSAATAPRTRRSVPSTPSIRHSASVMLMV